MGEDGVADASTWILCTRTATSNAEVMLPACGGLLLGMRLRSAGCSVTSSFMRGSLGYVGPRLAMRGTSNRLIIAAFVAEDLSA